MVCVCLFSVMKPVIVNIADYTESTIFGIIQEIQKYRFLYDIPPADRSCAPVVEKRDRTWGSIAELFGLPAGECLGIWKKLRSAFYRYFRSYRTFKNSATPYNPSNWKYYDSLVFLIPFVEQAQVKQHPPIYLSQSAVSNVAKKVLQKSKNILRKNKETSVETALSGLEPQIDSDKISIDIVLLVDLVKQHPALYSNPGSRTTHPDYVAHKIAVWKSIGHEIGAPAKACLAKWQYLTRRLSVVNTSKTLKYKWIWFDTMKWYLEFQRTRTRVSNVEDHATSHSEDTAFHVESTLHESDLLAPTLHASHASAFQLPVSSDAQTVGLQTTTFAPHASNAMSNEVGTSGSTNGDFYPVLEPLITVC